jgi:hypothetical protein
MLLFGSKDRSWGDRYTSVQCALIQLERIHMLRQFDPQYIAAGRSRDSCTLREIPDNRLRHRDAIAAAGSAEPAIIREALSSLKCFDGVTGKISIEKDGNVTRPIVITKAKAGRFVEVGAGTNQPRTRSAGKGIPGVYSP